MASDSDDSKSGKRFKLLPDVLDEINSIMLANKTEFVLRDAEPPDLGHGLQPGEPISFTIDDSFADGYMGIAEFGHHIASWSRKENSNWVPLAALLVPHKKSGYATECKRDFPGLEEKLQYRRWKFKGNLHGLVDFKGNKGPYEGYKHFTVMLLLPEHLRRSEREWRITSPKTKVPKKSTAVKRKPAADKASKKAAAAAKKAAAAEAKSIAAREKLTTPTSPGPGEPVVSALSPLPNAFGLSVTTNRESLSGDASWVDRHPLESVGIASPPLATNPLAHSGFPDLELIVVNHQPSPPSSPPMSPSESSQEDLMEGFSVLCDEPGSFDLLPPPPTTAANPTYKSPPIYASSDQPWQTPWPWSMQANTPVPEDQTSPPLYN